MSSTNSYTIVPPPTNQGVRALSCFHPFIINIMQTRLPESWKFLSFEKYDGASNPTTHVKVYLTHATLVFGDLWICCPLFPTTLKGTYLDYSLPHLSKDSFSTLYERFIAHFFDCKLISTDPVSILHVRQGDNESLRLYMT